MKDSQSGDPVSIRVPKEELGGIASPQEAANFCVSQLVFQKKWTQGFLPVIVTEYRDGRRVSHPFVVDISKVVQN